MNNTDKLISRLNELSDAVTKGKEEIDREFYMSIPARPDHDADLVLSDAAMTIAELTKQLSDFQVKHDSLGVASVKLAHEHMALTKQRDELKEIIKIVSLYQPTLLPALLKPSHWRTIEALSTQEANK